MDFTLTEEQQELRNLAAEIFTAQAPVARVEGVEASDERFDRALWLELAKAGFVGIAVGEQYGGLGLGMVELAVVCEQLGRAVTPVPLVWTTAAALAIEAHGSDEQRTRWLSGAVTGDTVLTTALPQSVREVMHGGGALTGTLIGVPYAHVASAVVVPVDGRLYIVDPNGGGVTVRLGTGTSREVMAELVLENAAVEAVGGDDTADWLWERTAVLLAAVQSGVTDATLRLAADYTSSRLQFGKPLSTFQGVAHRAADAYVDNAGIRATMLQAAWRLDEGGDARPDVLTAAWWAAEAGQRCVHASQHIHGGIGADVTYPAHRYFLWGKQIELMLGGASAILARLGDVLIDLEHPGDELTILA